MIQKQFFGGLTQLHSGATLLEGKPKVRIEEGYQVGASEHYVNVGEYEIENITYQGAEQERVSLTGKHQAERLSNQQMVYPVTMKNGLRFYTDFTREGDFYNNFDTNVTGVTERPDQGYVRFIGATSAARANFRLKPNIPFSRTMVKFRMSNISSNAVFAIDTNITDLDGNSEGYHRAIARLTDNVVREAHKYDGSFSGASDYAYTLNANTWYWLKHFAMGAKRLTYIASDINSFSEAHNFILEEDLQMTSQNEGQLGLYFQSGSGNIDIGEIEVVELDNALTKEDALRKVYTLGNVHDLKFQDKLSGVSDLTTVAGAGATWKKLSDSEILFFNDTGAGTTMNIAYYGVTMEDFTAEFEMKGASLNAGAFCGSIAQDSWVTTIVRLVPSGSNAQFYQNRASGYGLLNINWHGHHIGHLDTDKWHKMKFVKSGQFYGIYADGKFLIGGHGTSILDSVTQNNFFGVAVNSGGGVGATVSFRNIRISEFDEVLDGDLIIDPVSDLSSVANRLLDAGDAVINHGVTVEFIKKGASRGTHEVGTTALNTTTEGINNNTPTNQSWTFGDYNSIGIIPNENERHRNIGGDVRFSFREELSVSDASILDEISLNVIKEGNEQIDVIPATINNRPTMELYDQVNLVDERSTGVSEQYLIQNIQKSFIPDSGSFKMTINLGKYEN